MAIKVTPDRDYIVVGEELVLTAVDRTSGQPVSSHWWINPLLTGEGDLDDDHLVGQPSNAIAFLDETGDRIFEIHERTQVRIVGLSSTPDGWTTVTAASRLWSNTPNWREEIWKTSYYIVSAQVFENHLPLSDGETAFITPVPMMPHLSCKILPSESFQEIVHWKLEVRYPRRGGLDDRTFQKSSPGYANWNITDEFQEQFLGGEAVLSFKFGEAPWSKALGFTILGLNPTDVAVESFIDSLGTAPRYAKAIGQHETRSGEWYYNQFNPTGELRDQPNFGPPDGWGMCQLDSARGTPVTSEEVWNWKANCRSGIALMIANATEAPQYFAAIQRTFPQQWEAPPLTHTPFGTHTVWSYLEAAIIQMYNGSSIVRRLRSPAGPLAWYRSCWKFDENGQTGRRWEFVPNQNNYVRAITVLFESPGIRPPPETILHEFKTIPSQLTASAPEFSIEATILNAPSNTTLSFVNTRTNSLGRSEWDPIEVTTVREISDSFTFTESWLGAWGRLFGETNDTVRLLLNGQLKATMSITYTGEAPDGVAVIVVTR